VEARTHTHCIPRRRLGRARDPQQHRLVAGCAARRVNQRVGPNSRACPPCARPASGQAVTPPPRPTNSIGVIHPSGPPVVGTADVQPMMPNLAEQRESGDRVQVGRPDDALSPVPSEIGRAMRSCIRPLERRLPWTKLASSS